jgi:hypothetical protein
MARRDNRLKTSEGCSYHRLQLRYSQIGSRASSTACPEWNPIQFHPLVGVEPPFGLSALRLRKHFLQEDFLIAKRKGQRWSWNVIRPEAIIGTTNTPNGMNSADVCAVHPHLQGAWA